MPAPNVIVAPGLGRDIGKERANALKAQLIFRGTEAISSSAKDIGQAYMQYKEQQSKEDLQNMALLHDIIGTYGDAAGQPALNEYDKLLQKRGIGGLPKDPVTGDALPPPKTTAQLVDQQIKADPKAIAAMAQKQVQGISPLQESLKRHESDLKAAADAEKSRHDKAMEAAAMLRAQRTGLSHLSATQPSGFAMGTDGALIPLQPGAQPPEGYVPINKSTADAQFKSIDTANKTELNDSNMKLKKAQLDAKIMEAGNSLLFGPGKMFFNYAKAVTDGKIDKKFQKVMDPAFNQFLSDHGIDPVVEGPTFWEKTKAFFSSVGPDKLKSIQDEVNANAIPGEPTTKDGPVVLKLSDGTVIHKLPSAATTTTIP